MKPIIMPQVGQDIPDAVISRWLKKENDHVEKGEVVLVVESDKASFDIEAECSGILLKVLYQEGDRVEVFRPLAYIGEAEESSTLPSEERVPETAASPVAVAVTPSTAAEPFSERPSASPSARRLARERGVELSQVQGTGPGLRIIKRDILAVSAGAAPKIPLSAASEDEVVPFTRMRQRFAERLSLSKRTIPHFHLFVDVDMTEALGWRRVLNMEQGARITITDLVVHAVAQALKEFRRLNAHVGEDRLIIRKSINVGVAVSVENGLLVPVIPDADVLSLGEIAELSRKNAEAARRGFIDPRHIGTFTVSSLGMHGVSWFLPIINPPECAILGIGSAEARVAPVPGGIGVRDMMTLDLACDHRAVDGAYAAGFLNRVKILLETIGRAPAAPPGQGGQP